MKHFNTGRIWDPLPEKNPVYIFCFQYFENISFDRGKKKIAGLKKGDRFVINLYRTYFSPL